MKRVNKINLAKLTPITLHGVDLGKYAIKITITGNLKFPKGVDDIAIFGNGAYVSQALQDWAIDNGKARVCLSELIVLKTGQEISFHRDFDMLSEYTDEQIYLVDFTQSLHKGVREFKFTVNSKVKLGRISCKTADEMDVVQAYIQGINTGEAQRK